MQSTDRKNREKEKGTKREKKKREIKVIIEIILMNQDI